MNIFYTDHQAVVAATQLDTNRHNKMLTETLQILCTVAHKARWITKPSYVSCYSDETAKSLAVLRPDAQFVFAPTHKNHPCVLWAGENSSHFEWLLWYAHGLKNNYPAVYGKHVTIKRSLVLQTLWETPFKQLHLPRNMPRPDFVPPPMCVAAEYKATALNTHPLDRSRATVLAYRLQMAFGKPLKFKRHAPPWWLEQVRKDYGHRHEQKYP